MSLTTRKILNLQSFNPILLTHDVINIVHCFVHCHHRCLTIRDRDRSPLLKDEDRGRCDPNYSIYDSYNGEDIKNGEEINNNNTKIILPPDQ